MKQQHAAQIERLTRRIRELEQGLDEAYSSVSEEKHPLLKDESSGSGPPTPPAFKTSPPMMDHGPSVYPDDVIDHFGTPIVTPLSLCASSESWEHLGTLKIGPKGGSCFYGATARGEVSTVRFASGLRLRAAGLSITFITFSRPSHLVSS